jgi:D-alanine-D-alanine ligase
MVWTIVSKEEMEGYKIPPVFQYYREVVGKNYIALAVVDENDPLTFVQEGDVVLLRSANKYIISTIKKRGIVTTAEDYSIYEKVKDKEELGQWLQTKGVQVPRQYQLHEIEDGKTYFVKPRYGAESFGITKDSICSSAVNVLRQVNYIQETLNQQALIEEFIDGVDCTVACYYDTDTEDVKTYAIKIECEEAGQIQTHKGKFDYNEYCSALDYETSHRICEISKYVFSLIGIKHHARIDFRLRNDGELFLIDVNLLPGLGPSAHFAKCLLLTENKSYADAVWAIIDSAS